MSWNHRVVRRIDAVGESTYGVHEVYYNDDGTIYCYTEFPVEPMGETATELQRELEVMLVAFKKDILKEEDLPGFEKT